MVMNKMGDPLSEEEATELVRSADIDGDGKLNFEEVRMLKRKNGELTSRCPAF